MINNIKYFKLRKGITLLELSEITGFSIGYLSHLENGGRNNPSFNVMSKIAKALGKNITDIFLN